MTFRWTLIFYFTLLITDADANVFALLKP